MAVRRRNPNKVKHLTVGNFRGMMTPDLGVVLEPPFTQFSEGTVSVILGELRTSVSFDMNERITPAGELHGVQVKDGGRILAIGAGIWADQDEPVQETPIAEWV